MIVPLWGLYANMIAQLLSQISSHFIIHYHRKVVEENNKSYNENESMQQISLKASNSSSNDATSASCIIVDTEGKRRLCRHLFSRSHRGESDKLVVHPYVGYALSLLSLFSVALMALGTTFSSITLELYGLLGIAVETGQGFRAASFNYSVFGMAHLIMEQAKLLNTANNYLGLGALTMLFITCTLVVPLVLTATLLFQWFYPMTRKEMTRLSIIIEILQAWQYGEVFVVSVIVAAWQLGPTSEYMVNVYCTKLDSTLSMLAQYGILDVRDAQCFQVGASINFATYMVLLGTLLLALLNTFISNAASQYLDEEGKIRLGFEEKIDLLESEEVEEDFTQDVKCIFPPKISFVDKFRWCLIREDNTQ